MRHEPYRARKIFENTWVVDIGATCFCYLLVGREKALVIDTGVNPANLRAYLETLTDKPIMATNTHGHIDHTTCNGFFDEVYMQPEAIKDVNFGKNSESGNETLAGIPDYSPIPIREGYLFDLGGRHVKVFETPCHSPGDLMFLDVENRLLFTGDNLEVGQVLIFYGNDEIGGTVKRHLEMLKKMEAYYDAIDFICPGHNGSPIHKSVLKDFIENDERVLSGIEGTAELLSPSFPIDFFLPSEERRKYVRCSEWKNTWLIYDIRRVYESDGLYYACSGGEL